MIDKSLFPKTHILTEEEILAKLSIFCGRKRTKKLIMKLAKLRNIPCKYRMYFVKYEHKVHSELACFRLDDLRYVHTFGPLEIEGNEVGGVLECNPVVYLNGVMIDNGELAQKMYDFAESVRTA